MITIVEGMLERWRNHEGKEIEVVHEFMVLTSEMISRTAFGSNYVLGGEEYNRYDIEDGFHFKLMKTSDDIESNKLEKVIHDSITGEVENYGNDYLGGLMKCKTFYFSGYECTTSLLYWATLLLATHLDWQDKARKEVIDLFGHQQSPMIINESLRLYAPVYSIVRETKKKVRIGKVKLPANMQFYIPIHPERFAEGVAKATNNNIASFLAFSLAPRSCVDCNFATTEVKVALSMILQRYRITLSPVYAHAPVHLLTIHPAHGLQIILHPI
ncbi:hypothetical protein ACOSQ2_004145 [Xanthoceras sorbifolium]